MSATIALPNRPNHTGQATQIEQARAQAEVLAAMEAAKRWPRDEELCEQKMRKACARQLVADKAFWAFPRAGEQLTGPTINLAVTLAGIWGNMQYGVVELERSPSRRESQMLAVAWELESNTRATTTFLVPHIRDTKSGKKDLTDLRDVYENNANMGARRVREMIFKILPDWYTEMAEDICRGVIEKSDKPIAEQRAAIAKAFDSLGVSVEQLAAKVGRAWDQSMPGDLAILRIVGKSIRRGEATVREQFPAPEPAGPTAATITAAITQPVTGPDVPTPAAADETPPGEPEPDAGPPAGEVAKRERRMFALLREAGVEKDRDRRLALLSLIVGRELDSSSEMSHDDRKTVIDELEAWKRDGPLPEAVVERLSDAAELAAHDAARDAEEATGTEGES